MDRAVRDSRPVIAAGVAICALFGLAAGIGSYVFVYAKGYSYLSNDPAACANCHIMRDVHDGWQKGPHHAVAVCNDCHTPHTLVRKMIVKAENGWHHSQAFTLQNFHEPIRIREKNLRVLQENCLRCHGEFLGSIAPHGRIDGDDVNCIRCHRGVGHGPTR